jgi:hypothetical protein
MDPVLCFHLRHYSAIQHAIYVVLQYQMSDLIAERESARKLWRKFDQFNRQKTLLTRDRLIHSVSFATMTNHSG